MRSGLFCGNIYLVLIVSRWFSVPKPLSQIQRSTLCLLQVLSTRPSLGGFGLRTPDPKLHRFYSYTPALAQQ